VNPRARPATSPTTGGSFTAATVAREVPCPLCGSRATHVLLERRGAPIRRCAECSLAFAPAEPTPGELPALYAASYFRGDSGHYGDYVAEEPAHRRQARRYLRRLAAAGRRGGRILDVGCAAGFFLDEARRAGWRTRGVEVSEYASARARDLLGLDVLTSSFLDAPLDGERFDVVTFFNVFEHLSNPRAVEARLATLVRPGGLVLVETWNAESLTARAFGARWHQWDPRFVPYYYSRRSLGLIFDAARWRSPRWAPAAKWISLGRGLEILGRLSHSARARRLLERASRGPLGRLDVPYFTGDLVLAWFERR
jgi:SAM-dependent methyltransferase